MSGYFNVILCEYFYYFFIHHYLIHTYLYENRFTSFVRRLISKLNDMYNKWKVIFFYRIVFLLYNGETLCILIFNVITQGMFVTQYSLPYHPYMLKCVHTILPTQSTSFFSFHLVRFTLLKLWTLDFIVLLQYSA